MKCKEFKKLVKVEHERSGYPPLEHALPVLNGDIGELYKNVGKWV